MKAKFIEDSGARLALQFEPETDDERLLMRAFAAQCDPNNLLRIRGWGLGGDKPGVRNIRIYQERGAATSAAGMRAVSRRVNRCGPVVTLQYAVVAAHAKPGDRLYASPDSNGSYLRTGFSIVESANPSSGTITLTEGSQHAICAFADHDWLFVEDN